MAKLEVLALLWLLGGYWIRDDLKRRRGGNMTEGKEERAARLRRVQDEMNRYPFFVRAIFGVPLIWYLHWRDWRRSKA